MPKTSIYGKTAVKHGNLDLFSMRVWLLKMNLPPIMIWSCHILMSTVGLWANYQEKMCLMAYVNNDGPDQPVRTHRLIRAVIVSCRNARDCIGSSQKTESCWDCKAAYVELGQFWAHSKMYVCKVDSKVWYNSIISYMDASQQECRDLLMNFNKG